MTKMAAMPVYVKILQKSSSQEPFARNLVCSISRKSENSRFLETIATCDLNIDRCKQLDEKVKVYEYSRSRSSLDFGPRSFTY